MSHLTAQGLFSVVAFQKKTFGHADLIGTSIKKYTIAYRNCLSDCLTFNSKSFEGSINKLDLYVSGLTRTELHSEHGDCGDNGP